MTNTPSNTIELTGVFAQLMGAWYPKDFVVAAIDPTEGPGAVAALLSAGFSSDSIYLHDSEHFRQIGATIHEQRTPLQRAAASLAQNLMDEGLLAQEYIEAAQAGASLIGVQAPEPRLVEKAREILASHGARHMRYYGDRSITDL